MSSVEVYPNVVSDAEVLGGEAIIKGTRVPVSLILGHFAGGMSIDELVYEYDLTIENIRAALGYAAKRIAEEVIDDILVCNYAKSSDEEVPSWLTT